MGNPQSDMRRKIKCLTYGVTMNKTSYIFVSSYFPYDYKENWIVDEINAIPKDRLIYLIPRSKGKFKTNETNSNVKVINEPLLMWRDFALILQKPALIFKYIRIIFDHSNNLIDFMKRTCVLPKALRLSRFFKTQNCKHIHIYNTTSAASLALIIAAENGIPMSYTLHTTSQLSEKFRKNYEGISSNCSFVRCVSETAKTKLEDFLYTRVPKIFLTLGINGANIQKKRQYKSLKIIMVAALEEYKDIETAIAVVESIKRHDNDVKLDIFGDGSQRGRLEEIIQEKKLTNSINLKGVINRNALLNIIDADEEYSYILLTSKINKHGQVEGIPVALMEGMVRGLIPIVTKNGAVEELIMHGENGILLSTSMPTLIADQILELHRLSGLKKNEMSLHAQQTVNERFNAAANAEVLTNTMNKYRR